MRRLASLFFVTILFVFYLGLPLPAHGFGLSPAKIEVENIYKGDIYEAEVYVSKPIGDDICQYEISIEEPFAAYLSTDLNFLEFAPGELQKRVSILIDTRSLAAGSYKGNIYIREISNGNTVDIQTRLGLSVNFSVTEKVIEDVSVPLYLISVPNTKKLVFQMDVSNQGNVPAKFGKLELSLSDTQEESGKSAGFPINLNFSEDIISKKSVRVQGEAVVDLKEGAHKIMSRAFADNGSLIFEREDTLMVTAFNAIERKKVFHISLLVVSCALLAFCAILYALRLNYKK